MGKLIANGVKTVPAVPILRFLLKKNDARPVGPLRSEWLYLQHSKSATTATGIKQKEYFCIANFITWVFAGSNILPAFVFV